MTLCQHDLVLPEDLPSSLLQQPNGEGIFEKGLQMRYTLDRLEREYIKKILIDVGGNKSRAAEILGLDRKTLYRKLEEM